MPRRRHPTRPPRLAVERLEGRDAPSVSAAGGELAVNAYTTNTQSLPAIGLDADGDFVVAWQSNGQDGGGWGVYAQRYTAGGSPL